MFSNPWVILLVLFAASISIVYHTMLKPQTDDLSDKYFDACIYPGGRP